MYEKVILNRINFDFLLTWNHAIRFHSHTATKSTAAYFAVLAIYCTHTHTQQTQKLRDAWSVLQCTASVSARSLASFCIPSWTHRRIYTTDWQQPLPELLFRSWSRHLHKSAPYSPKPPRLQKQSSVTFPFFPHRLLNSSASISSNICLNGVILNYHDRGDVFSVNSVPCPRHKEEINVVLFQQIRELFSSARLGKALKTGRRASENDSEKNASFWIDSKKKKESA